MFRTNKELFRQVDEKALHKQRVPKFFKTTKDIDIA